MSLDGVQPRVSSEPYNFPPRSNHVSLATAAKGAFGMARSESGFRHMVIRLTFCLALVGMTSSAAAQINERDRLERCGNNRTALAQAQASWPSGAAGWSDEQISRARTALETLRGARGRFQLISGANTFDPERVREAILSLMRQSATTFGVPICYPEGDACADYYFNSVAGTIDTAERTRPQRTAIQQQISRHQTNLVALGCGQVVGTGGGSNVAASTAMMSGTFDSSFGTLTLSPGGGSYDYYGGQVQVAAVNGDVMEGIWTQTRAARQCPDGRYYGRFRFAFSANGFTGSFGYCDEEPGAGAWNGTRR